MKKKRLIILLSMIFGVLALDGCTKENPNNIVECTGVPTTTNTPLYTDKGICEKLAGGKPQALQCGQWLIRNGYFVCADNPKIPQTKDYQPQDYVKCFGIVAAGMNDCGTPTSACGGSVKVARDKYAWIAIPQGICQQIKGGTWQAPKGDNTPDEGAT